MTSMLCVVWPRRGYEPQHISQGRDPPGTRSAVLVLGAAGLRKAAIERASKGPRASFNYATD